MIDYRHLPYLHYQLHSLLPAMYRQNWGKYIPEKNYQNVGNAVMKYRIPTKKNPMSPTKNVALSKTSDWSVAIAQCKQSAATAVCWTGMVRTLTAVCYQSAQPDTEPRLSAGQGRARGPAPARARA